MVMVPASPCPGPATFCASATTEDESSPPDSCDQVAPAGPRRDRTASRIRLRNWSVVNASSCRSLSGANESADQKRRLARTVPRCSRNPPAGTARTSAQMVRSCGATRPVRKSPM